jgi:hypothetical protein
VELKPFDMQQRATLKSPIEQEEVLMEKEWLFGAIGVRKNWFIFDYVFISI